MGDKGCFREGFQVICSPSDNVAILADSSEIPLLEINNLTLGEARVQSKVARLCNSTSSTIEDIQSVNFSVGPSFTVSGARNKFTAIGCATVASIVRGPVPDDSSVTSACGSFCYKEDSIDNGTKCLGRGCCQSPIPESLNSFYPVFLTDVDNSGVQNFSACSYAFIAEEDSFKFDPSYAKSNSFQKHYNPHLVLDWVVGQETCAEAMKSESSYACKFQNSTCIDVPGRGYRCSCSAGYDGNPYLDGGCQDIDECKTLPQPCTKDGQCINTEGSYACTCSRGTHSDDAKSLPCTPTDDNGPNKMVIGISVALSLLSSLC
ncbi:wall-associated receptor kinase 1-like [Panicum miliaceum]|uniref:Wall-associated receptor kinase 1-like n=1 Tax=Panicum miliaceum TaxID=4540 RepID=A0A3L6PCY8_PANMI|nr:wall-associated receptor kinase 1-like [Panicum miliaceum]